MKTPVLRSADFNILLVALMYYLSAEVGFFLAFDNKGSLPIWPPAGISLGLVVLYGRRVWPGIAMGSLIITFKYYWVTSINSVQLLLLVAAVISAGHIFQAVAGEILMRKLVKRKDPFSTAMHTYYFVFIALLISTIGAGITSLVLLSAGVIQGAAVIRTLLTGWSMNVAGILVFSPLLLSIPGVKLKEITVRRIAELALFILSFEAVLFLFNLPALRNVFMLALPFVVIPFLLWLVFRFEVITSILGSVLVCLSAIYFTGSSGRPPYIPSLTEDSIMLVQIYIGVISLSTLVLAAVVRERQQAQSDLNRFNENLESLVQERTRALEEEVRSRTKAQQTLQETNAELTKKNTELDSFVYSVSHDLRAPIASILGLINLVKKEKTRSTQNMCFDMMEKSARQQDRFIKEIVDQSRNARLEIMREPVLFETLIEETFSQLDYSNLNGNTFRKVISVHQNQPFYCDKWRLKIILHNVISNSIRYKNGREPEIKVDATIDNHTVSLRIQDNGRGIKKEYLSNLGKMFYRATDEGAGAGLGLYIVKETVHKLNGSVDIESEEGEGTTVRFEIPEVV